MTPEFPSVSRPPSPAVGLLASLGLVVVWVTLRLVVFDTTMFPLTYAIPLLVCVWTRNRRLLWIMAATFAVFHLLKLFWILPPGTLAPNELWSSLIATMANILIAAIAIHAIINLRARLEHALADVREQAEELHAQGEELAQQNEELAEQTEELSRQAEELSHQGEELASQNEELQSQSEEIGTLNVALERRERLLESLLETTRIAGSDSAALQHVAAATLDLFADAALAVAIYERAHDTLALQAFASADPAIEARTADGDHALVSLVIGEARTAALDDCALRPDMTMPPLGGHVVGAALCAPIRIGGRSTGALAIYAPRPHAWTDEQFRVAEWLADQCGRMVQALRVQAELRDADARKSEFLATLSHELRNPLAPIRFALTLLEQGDGQQGKAIQVLQRQVHQLVRLVDDLLDVTRLSRNKIQVRPSRVDVRTIVQQAMEAATADIEAAGHHCTVTIPSTPVWLHADPDRMAQVVTNLVNNAIRYTPPGGRVTVALDVSDAEATLTVTDTGVGLNPGDLERVFDMFTQVAGAGSGGLGIGLALVRGIVELHGGRIEARSEGLGRGSAFRVTLPVMTAAAVEQETETPARASAGARRVLVVDDNADAAAMMATLLELEGHQVWVAHDAESALATLSDALLDVALLDIGLPGLDGYELARRVRQDARTKHVRLVAVTGWGQGADRARARDAGFDAHLTKPAEPLAVLAALHDTPDGTPS